jgi:hypothetical protein
MLAFDPLRAEQRGEIGVVDADVGVGGDLGLGAIGDAETGGFEHREIVSAVADGGRVAERPALGGDALVEPPLRNEPVDGLRETHDYGHR